MGSSSLEQGNTVQKKRRLVLRGSIAGSRQLSSGGKPLHMRSRVNCIDDIVPLVWSSYFEKAGNFLR